MKVSEIMTKDIISINPEEKVINALEVMIRNNIRRLVVADLLPCTEVRGFLQCGSLVWWYISFHSPPGWVSSPLPLSPCGDSGLCVMVIGIKPQVWEA